MCVTRLRKKLRAFYPHEHAVVPSSAKDYDGSLWLIGIIIQQLCNVIIPFLNHTCITIMSKLYQPPISTLIKPNQILVIIYYTVINTNMLCKTIHSETINYRMYKKGVSNLYRLFHILSTVLRGCAEWETEGNAVVVQLITTPKGCGYNWHSTVELFEMVLLDVKTAEMIIL